MNIDLGTIKYTTNLIFIYFHKQGLYNAHKHKYKTYVSYYTSNKTALTEFGTMSIDNEKYRRQFYQDKNCYYNNLFCGIFSTILHSFIFSEYK